MRQFAIFTVLLVVFGAIPTPCGAADACLIPSDSEGPSWKIIFRKNGITVSSCKTPGTDILTFKASGLLNAPVGQVMEVLRKVETSMEWMPDIREKFTVRDISDYEAYTFSVSTLPWPFADREMLLHNKLRLDRKNKYLVVEVYSVDMADYPVQARKVRAHMYCGRTMMRPAGEKLTEFTIMLSIDPRGHIPAWLANFAQTSMPYDFLRALEKQAASTHYTLRPAFQKVLDELVAILN